MTFFRGKKSQSMKIERSKTPLHRNIQTYLFARTFTQPACTQSLRTKNRKRRQGIGVSHTSHVTVTMGTFASQIILTAIAGIRELSSYALPVLTAATLMNAAPRSV